MQFSANRNFRTADISSLTNNIFVNLDNAENFMTNWNAKFPDDQITVEQLKKPHSLFKYLFLIFNRLGIDIDAVLMVSFIYIAHTYE